MGRFSGFYTGGSLQKDFSSKLFPGATPAEKKAIQLYGAREVQVWKIDYFRCSTIQDYKNYIEKYKQYEHNPYLTSAKIRLRIIGSGGEGSKGSQSTGTYIPRQTPMISYDFLKPIIWVIILVVIGGYTYSEYQEKQKKIERLIHPVKQQSTNTIAEPTTFETQSDNIGESVPL